MRKLILIDYDETIILKNSFPLWVIFLLKHSFFKFRFIVFLKIAFLLIRRKIFCTMSHHDFKKSMMMLDIPSFWNQKFSSVLDEFVRDDFKKIIKDACSKGDVVVVSSAAPMCYLKFAVRSLCDEGEKIHIFGSVIFKGKLSDNFKEGKVKSLIDSKLLDPSGQVDVLYTDSSDDIPIAKLSKKVFLISPSEIDKEIFISLLGDEVVEIIN